MQKEEFDRGNDEEEDRHIKEMVNEKPASPIGSKLTGNLPGNTQYVVAAKKFPCEISHAKYLRMLCKFVKLI